jgi:hypothetical protein
VNWKEKLDGDIMANHPNPTEPTNYRIKVSGKVKDSWSEWFNGMAIEFEMETGEQPVSTLNGTLADQSALFGVLNKIRNLGLKLLSVEQISPEMEMDKEDL